MRTRSNILALLIIFALIAGACGGGDAAVDTTATTSATTTINITTTNPASPDTTEGATSSTAAPPAAAGVSDTLQAILDRGAIRIAVGPRMTPFRIDLTSATPSGFEVALASAVVNVIAPGVAVEFTEIGYAQRFAGLAEGAFDMELGLTFHTKARESSAQFSIPYFLGGLAVLVNADSDVMSIADLEGEDVLYVYVGGGSSEAAMKDTFAAAGASVVGPAESSAQLVDSLLAGRVKAAAMVYPRAVVEQSKPGASFRVVPIDILRNPIAIATPLDDVAFQQEVSKALQSLIDDGTWLKLFEEWIGTPAPWTTEEMAGVPVPAP